jgi:hypothetical protein
MGEEETKLRAVTEKIESFVIFLIFLFNKHFWQMQG